MDKFEKLIKSSVESYEAPYSEAAWTAMSKKLGPSKGGIGKWIALGSVAAVLVSFGVWYGIEATAKSNDTTNVIASEKISSNDHIIQNHLGQDEVHQTPSISNTEIESEKTKVKTEEVNSNSIYQKAAVDVENSDLKNKLDKGNHSSDILPTINNIPANNIGQLTPKDEQPISDIGAKEEKVDFSKFNLSAIADKMTVCVGEIVNFSPSIPKLKANYVWDFGREDQVVGPYAAKTFAKAGDYLVKLSLVDKQTKEVLNTSKAITIHVNAQPVNEITYEYSNTVQPQVSFKQKNHFYKTINWEIKGLYSSSEATFSFAFKQKGNYIVSCELIDDNNCKSTSNTVVNIENNYNLMAPNAFSPNGDNLNETFIPKALLINNLPFIMTIYDKSGKLVYETNDASRPWDGLYTKDLTPAPGGAYIWVVQLTNEHNEVESYQGQVLITR